MKYTRYIALPAISLLVLAATGQSTIHLLPVSSTLIGPFSNEENPVISFTVRANLTRLRGTVSIKNDYGTISSQSEYVVKNAIRNVELDLKDRFYNGKSLYLNVNFEQNGTVLFEDTQEINLPNPQTLRIKQEVYKFEKCCYYIDNKEVYNYEKYDFRNFNDLYSIGKNNELDISGMSFDYYPSKKLTYKNAYLIIKDYENVFPNIAKTGNEKIVAFPLTLNCSNKNITFSFNTKLYVNYSNYDLSDHYLPGYEKTNTVYLPLNTADKFESNESEIVIQEIGFNKNNFTIPISYFKSSKHFGACYDSDYCVHGGIKE